MRYTLTLFTSTYLFQDEGIRNKKKENNMLGGLAVTASDLHTEATGFESICVHSGRSSALVLRALVVE